MRLRPAPGAGSSRRSGGGAFACHSQQPMQAMQRHTTIYLCASGARPRRWLSSSERRIWTHKHHGRRLCHVKPAMLSLPPDGGWSEPPLASASALRIARGWGNRIQRGDLALVVRNTETRHLERFEAFKDPWWARSLFGNIKHPSLPRCWNPITTGLLCLGNFVEPDEDLGCYELFRTIPCERLLMELPLRAKPLL